MNKEIPVANRVIHERVTHRNNCILTDKIIRMKFANFSALQGQSEFQSVKRSAKLDQTKLKSLEARQVRSVIEHQRIRSQNKMILKRLVKQKSTLSNKIFAQQRHRNIQFLKRIGRFPYKNMEVVQEDTFTQENKNQEGFNRRHTLGNFDENDTNSLINVALSNNSSEQVNRYSHNLIQMLTVESKKQHIIILWTKAIQLGKSWYTIQYIRLKDHYQIELIAYSTPKTRYSLRLGQKEGTSLLTEFDYDYALISSQCLKISEPNIHLSFEMKHPKKKRHFYRFEKKDTTFNSQREKNNVEIQRTQAHARKTMFAIENECNEKKYGKIDKIKRNTNKEINLQPPDNLLNIHCSDIFLQPKKQ